MNLHFYSCVYLPSGAYRGQHMPRFWHCWDICAMVALVGGRECWWDVGEVVVTLVGGMCADGMLVRWGWRWWVVWVLVECWWGGWQKYVGYWRGGGDVGRGYEDWWDGGDIGARCSVFLEEGWLSDATVINYQCNIVLIYFVIFAIT